LANSLKSSLEKEKKKKRKQLLPPNKTKEAARESQAQKLWRKQPL